MTQTEDLRALALLIRDKAVRSLRKTAFKTGARAIGLPDEPGFDPYTAETIEAAMLRDVTLFEPNTRGTRPFDQYAANPRRPVPADLADLATRMRETRFTIFRPGKPHPDGGVWAEDMRDNDRAIWIADPALNVAKKSVAGFATRVFDAGPFFIRIGPALFANDDLLQFWLLLSATRSGPWGNAPLSEPIYEDELDATRPMTPDERDFNRALNEYRSIFGEQTQYKPPARRPLRPKTPGLM